jgi:hypothetical protein
MYPHRPPLLLRLLLAAEVVDLCATSLLWSFRCSDFGFELILPSTSASIHVSFPFMIV